MIGTPLGAPTLHIKQLPANSHAGKQQVMVQVRGSLPPTQRTEFQAPDQGLAHPWLLEGIWGINQKIDLSLSVEIKIIFKG